MKTALKTILFWVTAFIVISYILGIDILIYLGYLLPMTILCIFLFLLCYIFISERELYRISGYRWLYKKLK